MLTDEAFQRLVTEVRTAIAFHGEEEEPALETLITEALFCRKWIERVREAATGGHPVPGWLLDCLEALQ